MNPLKTTGILLVASMLLLTACSPGTNPTTDFREAPPSIETLDPRAPLELHTFSSEEQLKAFLRSHRDEYSAGQSLYFARSSAQVGAPVPTMAQEVSTDSVKTVGGGDGYSTTNNQVAGVDEADIIKTDGKFIYTTSGNTLFIVSAGSDAAVVSRTDLSYQPSGLFIEGDRLMVFLSVWDSNYFSKLGIRPRNSVTVARIYDTTDRAKPTQVTEYTLEGNYNQARLVGSTAYVVLSSTPDWREPMPLLLRDGERITQSATDIAILPYPYSSVQYASVHAIPFNGDALRSKTVTVDGQPTVYMSASGSIYLASTKYISEWELRSAILQEIVEPKLSSADRSLIAKIHAADSEVISAAEKKSKIQQVYDEYVQFLPTEEREAIESAVEEALAAELEKYEAMEYTILTRIDAQGTALALGPVGQVPGHVLNQFSMDEHNAVLRVATTTSARWFSPWRGGVMMDVAVAEPAVAPSNEAGSANAEAGVALDEIAPKSIERIPGTSESTNAIYTLDDNLKVLDSITGIAPGEQVFSARFMGERLYLVTYRQVDPFFVFDLSDAKNIKQLGELKVPGFSRYLHPYDDNTIIGIGREATATGRTEGLKISIFDVTDVSKPKEIAKWVSKENEAQSSAEYEHKAFLFDREKELLVIPAYAYDWTRGSGTERYNGAMVFRIQRDAIELRGIVDHSQGSLQSYGPLVERSLWIEEMLYTKSPNLLRINLIDSLASVANVSLESKGSGPYPVY